MNIIPIGEKVLLEPIEKETKTTGGIYIPESAQKEKKEGIIKSVGTYIDGRALPVRVGDRVVYGGYSSEEFEHQGKKYFLIDIKDILAKFGGQ